MLMPSIFGEDLFDDFMRFPMEHEMRTRGAQANKELMRTDIREVDGNYELDIDLPGYKKEDMKLQLKDGYLTIRLPEARTRKKKRQQRQIYPQRALQRTLLQKLLRWTLHQPGGCTCQV